MKTGEIEFDSYDFDTRKNELLTELRNSEYNDHEIKVYTMELTYDKIVDILEIK